MIDPRVSDKVHEHHYTPHCEGGEREERERERERERGGGKDDKAVHRSSYHRILNYKIS